LLAFLCSSGFGDAGLLLDYRMPPSPLPLWNHRVKHVLACKIRRTKDLEVKIWKAEELGADFLVAASVLLALRVLPLLGQFSNQAGAVRKVRCHSGAVEIIVSRSIRPPGVNVKIPWPQAASRPTFAKEAKVGQPQS
jgi:hypothetical protein